MNEQELAPRMRALADRSLPDVAQRLREEADRLEAVLHEPDCTIPRLVGSWARARRVWCEITGEPLV